LAYAEQDGADWASLTTSTQDISVPGPSRWWVSAAAAAAALIALLAGWWHFQDTAASAPIVATTQDGSEFLNAGNLHLDLGESREIVFLKGTRVALEGPAEVELLSDEKMRLNFGKIGVDVPDGAEGFTVITPSGEVIDYGTRFGLSVEKSGEMRAEVFEGRIEVSLGKKIHRMEGQASLDFSAAGTELQQGSNPSGYPMPSSTLHWSVDGNFNTPKKHPSGRPHSPNQWSGDPTENTLSTPSIKAASGKGMLQFLSTNDPPSEELDTVASQLWRIVDLHEVREKMGRRPTNVTLSAWVNRINGSSTSDTIFLLGLSAHQFITDELEDGPGVLVKTQTAIESDSDPITWERADLSLQVPPGLRYLVVMLGANENVRNDLHAPEFDGHFIDNLKMTFHAGMRSSAITRHWRGSPGNWSNPKKWSENTAPASTSIAVIQGAGTASITEEIRHLSGSLVLGRDDASQGSLHVKEKGTLHLGETETIIGFNPGASATCQIDGTLTTDGPLYIGRNNAHSLMQVRGSLISTNLIQLSQYDSPTDTRSELEILGGSLHADSLRLLYDQSQMLLLSGTVHLKSLTLGGTTGNATLTQRGGTLRTEQLTLGKGTYLLESGQLWIKMPPSELSNFLPGHPRHPKGDWTLILPRP